jgi:hypothetical protein
MQKAIRPDAGEERMSVLRLAESRQRSLISDVPSGLMQEKNA